MFQQHLPNLEGRTTSVLSQLGWQVSMFIHALIHMDHHEDFAWSLQLEGVCSSEIHPQRSDVASYTNLRMSAVKKRCGQLIANACSLCW